MQIVRWGVQERFTEIDVGVAPVAEVKIRSEVFGCRAASFGSDVQPMLSIARCLVTV